MADTPRINRLTEPAAGVRNESGVHLPKLVLVLEAILLILDEHRDSIVGICQQLDDEPGFMDDTYEANHTPAPRSDRVLRADGT